MTPIVGRPRTRGGRDGAIAQLGERVVRNDEVGGSIPPGSTSLSCLRQLRLGKPYHKRRLPRRSPMGEDGLRRNPLQTFLTSELLPLNRGANLLTAPDRPGFPAVRSASRSSV